MAETRQDPPRWRRFGGGLLFVLLLLGPLLARVYVDGRAELRAAEVAAQAGDREAELRHLGRAARWRLPLAGHDEIARARLRERAEQAAAAGRTGEALAAWRELRSALLGTRAIDVADREQLAAANQAIVALMGAEARALGAPVDSARWAAQLDEDTLPRTRSLFAALCFGLWVAASIGFFSRAIDGKGRLQPRPALRWGAAVLLSLVAWILAL